ncbi:MAG: hypothetical protein DHS80DRAFT_25165 [Piptocephalis tieghemiana]|nr:MAG: hypothetical protein DHS80DRAFT_25165 [Piptocephalis tieghemiana]
MSSKATIIEEESDQGFDLQLLSIYVMGVAALLGLAYWAKNAIFNPVEESGKKKKKTAPVKSSSATTTTTTSNEGNKSLDTDWIPEHHLNKNGRRSSPRLKKRKA